jgi:hypothetical protein
MIFSLSDLNEFLISTYRELAYHAIPTTDCDLPGGLFSRSLIKATFLDKFPHAVESFFN